MLRPLHAADVDALAEIARDPGFARWWPELDAAALVAKSADETDAVVFTVTLAGTVIGLAQYYENDDPEYRHAGIDLGLDSRWHGQGLGTDAVRTLARHLVDDLGHHRVVIDPRADNAIAIRCYEKVGFRAVGVMRRYQREPDDSWHDGLLMDLLADELVRE